jgi:hypothetical protein
VSIYIYQDPHEENWSSGLDSGGMTGYTQLAGIGNAAYAEYLSFGGPDVIVQGGNVDLQVSAGSDTLLSLAQAESLARLTFGQLPPALQ